MVELSWPPSVGWFCVVEPSSRGWHVEFVPRLPGNYFFCIFATLPRIANLPAGDHGARLGEHEAVHGVEVDEAVGEQTRMRGQVVHPGHATVLHACKIAFSFLELAIWISGQNTPKIQPVIVLSANWKGCSIFCNAPIKWHAVFELQLTNDDNRPAARDRQSRLGEEAEVRLECNGHIGRVRRLAHALLHGQTNALSERIVYVIYRVAYFQPRHPLTSRINRLSTHGCNIKNDQTDELY